MLEPIKTTNLLEPIKTTNLLEPIKTCHFPMFPHGFFEAKTCDEGVEDVQLTAGMGNEVTLVVTGDR